MSGQFEDADLMKCSYRKLVGHLLHPVITQDAQNEHPEQHISVEENKNTYISNGKHNKHLLYLSIYLSIYSQYLRKQQ